MTDGRAVGVDEYAPKGKEPPAPSSAGSSPIGWSSLRLLLGITMPLRAFFSFLSPTWEQIRDEFVGLGLLGSEAGEERSSTSLLVGFITCARISPAVVVLLLALLDGDPVEYESLSRKHTQGACRSHSLSYQPVSTGEYAQVTIGGDAGSVTFLFRTARSRPVTSPVTRAATCTVSLVCPYDIGHPTSLTGPRRRQAW